MELQDLINSFLTLLGLAVLIAFAITGARSAYLEHLQEKKETGDQSLEDHFLTIVKD